MGMISITAFPSVSLVILYDNKEESETQTFKNDKQVYQVTS